jgi:hypothetical protein
VEVQLGSDEREPPTDRRSLTAYLSAYSLSMLGDRFGELALPLVILAATRNPAAAGAVGASIQAPTLLLALWLGRRVDRHSRRFLLLSADLGRAACFAVFAWLAASSISVVWPFVVVGLVVGTANSLHSIAGSAILPEIAQGQGLVRANALTEAGDAVTTVAGPANAGAVISKVNAAAALAVDAVTFLGSAILLLRVRVPGRSDPGRTAEELAEPAEPAEPVSLLSPLRHVLRDPVQRAVQVGLSTLSAHGAAVVLAIIVLANSELHLSPARLGLVLGAAGIGGLAASAVATRWPAPFATVSGIGMLLWLSAGFAAVLAWSNGFWWALIANGLLDGAITGAFIATAVVRQQYTPVAMLGRISAASLVYNGVARLLGVGGIGLLLSGFDGRTALMVDSALLAVAAGCTSWSARHRVEDNPRRVAQHSEGRDA